MSEFSEKLFKEITSRIEAMSAEEVDRLIDDAYESEMEFQKHLDSLPDYMEFVRREKSLVSWGNNGAGLQRMNILAKAHFSDRMDFSPTLSIERDLKKKEGAVKSYAWKDEVRPVIAHPAFPSSWSTLPTNLESVEHTSKYLAAA